jgi:tRNA(Ile)-lysidine synthase
MIIENLSIPLENFAVAVSGGEDSLCLSLLAHEFAVANNLTMRAIFVDHKLRDESLLEISPIIDLFKGMGIEHEILSWEHPTLSGNLEKRARDARYTLLTSFCKRIEVELLLVAHHSLDQWETFFMRLAKGSGPSGLCSMKEFSTYNDVKIYRPLLRYSKFDIRETLTRKFKIDLKNCVKDPMNDDCSYERVRWRRAYNTLSKQYGLDTENICKSIERLQRAEECLDVIAKKHFSETFEGTYLNIETFKNLHIEIRSRVLKKVIEKVTGKYGRIISYSLLSSVSENICATNFKAANISGCLFKKDKTKNIKISIEKRKAKV